MKFIAVDWGSSSFRAYLIDNAGQVADRIENNNGVFNLTDREFSATLDEACRLWLEHWPNLPIVMAGMIGSRNGWFETPYVTCPVKPADLTRHLCHLATPSALNIYIVPGICGKSPSYSPDVMRGEEVQIFGALKLVDQSNAMICLPGTHSKWARIQDGAIRHFSTFLTGEIFALLREQSSIGSIMDETPVDDDSFIQGVQFSRAAGGLLHHIFSARARLLTHHWQGRSLSSYLSGVVIGNEFSGARTLYPNSNELLVVGNEQLQQHYQLAADVYGYQSTNIDSGLATITGLSTIADNHLSLQMEIS